MHFIFREKFQLTIMMVICESNIGCNKKKVSFMFTKDDVVLMFFFALVRGIESRSFYCKVIRYWLEEIWGRRYHFDKYLCSICSRVDIQK